MHGSLPTLDAEVERFVHWCHFLHIPLSNDLISDYYPSVKYSKQHKQHGAAASCEMAMAPRFRRQPPASTHNDIFYWGRDRTHGFFRTLDTEVECFAYP